MLRIEREESADLDRVADLADLIESIDVIYQSLCMCAGVSSQLAPVYRNWAEIENKLFLLVVRLSGCWETGNRSTQTKRLGSKKKIVSTSQFLRADE